MPLRPPRRRRRKPEAAGALGRQGERRLGAWGRGRRARAGQGRMGWGEAEPRRGGRRREPFPLRAAAAAAGGARWFRFPGAAAGPSRQLPRSVAGGGGGGGGASPEAVAGPATARGRGRGGGGRPAASAACLGLVPAPSSPSSVPEHVGRSQLVRPVRTAIVTGRGGG